jgi:hypothetical protein
MKNAQNNKSTAGLAATRAYDASVVDARLRLAAYAIFPDPHIASARP